MKKFYTIIVLLLIGTVLYAQPPIPPTVGGYNLSSGTPYSFTEWAASSQVASYPPNTTLITTIRTQPNEWATTYNMPNNRLGIWLCPYNLNDRSRFIGLGTRGMQVTLTQAGQNILCNTLPITDTISSRPFAFNVSLDTRGISDAAVTYTAQVTQLGTQPNPRETRIALCYRLGIADTFTLLPNATVFSSLGRSLTDSLVETVTLPANLLNRELVQLAWIFYLPNIPTATGVRPSVRLDNISVVGTPTSVSKRAAFQFAVAPNPSQGAVKVTDSYVGKKEITVYNLLGAKVAEVSSETTVTELNIQTKGMYMLEVKHIATGETATKKLIIE
jgi:hypothetical protein